MPESEFDLSPLLTAAIQLHELMMGFIEAGFTEEQAFRMVLHILPGPAQG